MCAAGNKFDDELENLVCLSGPLVESGMYFLFWFGPKFVVFFQLFRVIVHVVVLLFVSSYEVVSWSFISRLQFRSRS